MRRILDLAVQVFGSMKIAQCWMDRPRDELDGKSPSDLIQDGKADLVVKILEKIANNAA